MTLGKKFDGVAGGVKKNQWDKAPWEFFNYIVSYITNKDKKDLWRAGKALVRYYKHGNPEAIDNTLAVAWHHTYQETALKSPTEEEIAIMEEAMERDEVDEGRYVVPVHGMRKYGVDNWQFVRPFNDRYFAALIRHLFTWRIHQKIDPDFAQSHLRHAECCLRYLMWGEQHLDKNEKEYQ